MSEIQETVEARKLRLRQLIPRTYGGNTIRTDRLERLDTMLMSQEFSHDDLDFVEHEINNSVAFFKERFPERGEQDE